MPTATGVLAVLAVLVVEAGRSLFGAFGVGNAPAATPRFAVLLACIGFGMLGLFDDLVGSNDDGGFRGHLRALISHGRVTTGVVKIVGGGALAVVLVSAGRAGGSGVRVVSDALLVALAANLTNLFDRAPGARSRSGCWPGFRSRSSRAPTASASRSRRSSARSRDSSVTICTSA